MSSRKGRGRWRRRRLALAGPIQVMMKSLLADRFKLVARIEKKEMPIYALTLARNDGRLGSQLKASTIDCAAVNASRGAVVPRQVRPTSTVQRRSAG